MDNRPIGVFDSGVGGLTVVKQVMKLMPNEKIIYFGDTARLPYGSKSKETVTRFSKQIVRFLLTQDVKAIVVACNTVSSNSLDDLKKEFDVPVFGVVMAGAIDAVNSTKNNKIGIIGTAATVRSHAYEKLVLSLNPDISVYQKACPLFVPLVEEGWTDNEIVYLIVKNYLEDFLKTGVDSIVLGCTHYPLLKKCIGETVGKDILLLDPAASAVLQVKEYLKKSGSLNGDKTVKEHIFYLSDITEKFDMLCKMALNKTFVPKALDIEKY
ncbi:MAG: glutamate racemase [Lachnospiraceae bacterium]|nr:glutamate racemase [Lachnospiraceae bacterium]